MEDANQLALGCGWGEVNQFSPQGGMICGNENGLLFVDIVKVDGVSGGRNGADGRAVAVRLRVWGSMELTL